MPDISLKVLSDEIQIATNELIEALSKIGIKKHFHEYSFNYDVVRAAARLTV